MKKSNLMSDEEMLAELGSGSMRNQVRKVISSFVAECEQDAAQLRGWSAIDLRHHEFAVADRIIALILKGGE